MTESVAPRRRRWPYILLALLLILGIGLGLAWRYRLQVAEQAATMALGVLGLGNDVSFRITDIEPDRIRVEDLRYGEDGPTALAAEIIFAPGALARGHLKLVRLIEPVLTLIEAPDGGWMVAGLPAPKATSDASDDAAKQSFPKLPDIDRLEVIGGHLRADHPSLQANGSFAATVIRDADGRLDSTVTLAAADSRGRELTLAISGLAATIREDQISLKGPAQLRVDDTANATRAALDVWLSGTLTPEGVAAGEVVVVTGNGRLGKRLSVEDVRGRITGGMSGSGVSKIRADVNLIGFSGDPASLDVVNIAADVNHGAASLTIDGFGPSGHVSFTADRPQSGDHLALAGSGAVDAALAAVVAPMSDVVGRVGFEANLTSPIDLFQADPSIHQLSGAAALVFEIRNANFAGLAPEGSAFGQLDLGISGGAVTVTSPGLRLGGIKLPPAVLASLPIDFRRAFDDSAFLRFGEEGLGKTVVTISQRPEGGFAAVGQLGLALSNPNLALFVEGGGAVATTASGALEHVESERLKVRVVDAQLGPATVSGNIELAGFSGAGQRFSADAKVSLGARMSVGGYQIKRAEVDVAGPLDVGPAAAVLAPRAGGRIRVNGFSGPLLKILDPIRLTLTKRGARRIVYDRLQDQLRMALEFQGFQARGVMNAAVGGGSRINLALGGAGVTVDRAGAALTLSGA
ncbi:MAG: hypothetical protein ACKVH0_06405, partial [Alphaproteobacteria bacterium]